MSDSTHVKSNEDREIVNRLARRLAVRSQSESVNTETQANLQEDNAPAKDQSLASAESAVHSNEQEQANPSYYEISRAVGDNAFKERYHSNMAAFFKYEPNIYKQFCSYRPSQPLDLQKTKSGGIDLFLPKLNEFFYKDDDPVDLCNRQVDVVLKTCPFKNIFYNLGQDEFGQLHNRYLNEMTDMQVDCIPDDYNPLLSDSCPIAIVLGVGLGYHLRTLYERIKIGNLIVIEPNADLFYASLYTFDWASLLEVVIKERRGLYLMVGHSKDEVFNSLNEFYSRHGAMLAGFIWTMIHYRSDKITEIANQLGVDYSRSYNSLGFFDDGLFSISHGSYLLTHHARFMRRDVRFSEEILNKPVCVVANGPSLSNDLPVLRKVQDKVIIIACGSALETLYNAGIKPLFYAATERLKVVAESLSLIPDQEYVQDTILIAPDVCHPDTFKLFKHTACLLKSDEVFFVLAGLQHPQKLGNIQAAGMINPLVGNLGLMAARVMGFKNIYLFGVDNGTKYSDMLHPEESILYKNKVERDKCSTGPVQYDKRGRKVPSMHELNYFVPGNFGGDVRSSYVYKVSLRYMELVITETTNINYYNCSDGALITGAKPTHSSELLEDWLKLPDLDTQSIVDFVDQKMTVDLNFTEEDVVALCDYDSFDALANIVIKLLSPQEPLKSRLDYVFMFERVFEVLHTCSNNRQYMFAVQLLRGSLSQYFMMTIRVLYFTDDENLALERAAMHMGWIFDFLDDAKRIYRFVPYYYGEDHLKFLNNKVGYDHPDSKAPTAPVRKALVTQADRDKYPVRKFVKRYE